ncbi:MAG: MMPL family transporter, partial [Bacteroidetes bacterium]|nr:MMPL family transporter [Bacteroidota bacterium]
MHAPARMLLRRPASGFCGDRSLRASSKNRNPEANTCGDCTTRSIISGALLINLRKSASGSKWLRKMRATCFRETAAMSIFGSSIRPTPSKVTRAFKEYHASVLDTEGQDIRAVRQIMNKYRNNAQLYLGGVRMITADMISFIEHDIAVFGFGVVCFLIVALTYFFRKLRWVALPMSCCLISVSVMVGFLGFLDWRVTVVSSNFISLLLIITMSLTIHLIVRYRILAAENPSADQQTLVFDTVRIMAKPCFYTAITTVVAFCSLVVSDIRPVIDFGWMMTVGIAFAFAINFIYFPSILTLLRLERTNPGHDSTQSFTLAVASFTQNNLKKILVLCSVLALLGVIGIFKLEVENRFIDNFKSSTEIYQGMELIDLQLGGTIPLDIVIDADTDFYASLEELEESADLFDDPFAEEGET